MMSTPTTVVLLPGIYMPGFTMVLLARRLRRYGYNAVIFSYPSLRGALTDNAERLWRFMQFQQRSDTIHLVGHSLGGLVIRHMLAQFANRVPSGIAVTLGTPHQGSCVAHSMQAKHIGFLLGKSRHHGLLNGLQGDIPDLPEGRVLGSLAGIARFGVGCMLTSLATPHDGTVEVRETVFPDMHDHVCLPVNHTALLTDRESARQTAFFLQHQRFDHSYSKVLKFAPDERSALSVTRAK